jgi:hypothetical protein
VEHLQEMIPQEPEDPEEEPEEVEGSSYVFLIALALFLFLLIALVARVRHGHEMRWLSVVSKAFCIMDVLVCGPLLWCYENRLLCYLCSVIFLHVSCVSVAITSSSFIRF